MSVGDDKSLAALAAALLQNPRATYAELSAAIGVSRATLYRFCSSREELELRLLRHAMRRLTDNTTDARLHEGPARQAFSRLVDSQLADKELAAFATEYWNREAILDPEIASSLSAYEETVDAFFLRGQREGVFRIDIGAAALNESFIALFCGLIDAEGRGRIARASLKPTIEAVFLQGVTAE